MEMYNLDFKKSLLLVVSALLLGVLVGVTTKNQHTTVAYVSQEEIVELEKARISSIEDPAQKQMFLGKPREAATLMENIASTREDKNTIVVFSAGRVYGDDVISISRDVYDETMASLEKGLSEADEILK